ncbi:hypothetical protein NHX12_003340 [Muraenolepis orangiensis]|uniref:Uncharacterized protein n=1 Tax=Muraenolepis orangiensis TaxID=630683 RepID=A0A9Q0DXV5_9TELE|nr:hypothetical protein NHX12_003340 [Muraenolepis orangiensis]
MSVGTETEKFWDSLWALQVECTGLLWVERHPWARGDLDQSAHRKEERGPIWTRQAPLCDGILKRVSDAFTQAIGFGPRVTGPGLNQGPRLGTAQCTVTCGRSVEFHARAALRDANSKRT